MVELAGQRAEVSVDHPLTGCALLEPVHLDLLPLARGVVRDFPKQLVLLEQLPLRRRNHLREVDQKIAKPLRIARPKGSVDAVAEQVGHSQQGQCVTLISRHDRQASRRFPNVGARR